MPQTQARDFTLLLVDDNLTNLLLVSNIIELDLPQVRILTARSAKEGLTLAAQEQIDGAFIDVQMPQMSGLEMGRELRAREKTARIPLVLMTAHTASPRMRAEGLEVGAYDFISQPISNVEMLARIKVMLRMCANERLIAQHSPQALATANNSNLRWLEGLLLSGESALSETDPKILEPFVERLQQLGDLEPEQLLRRLVTELPSPCQRTIFKLALVGKIPLALAPKLSEISDIKSMFDYLRRHGLALAEVNNDQEILTFSPGLCAFLKEQAEQHLDGDQRQETLMTAAEWFRSQQDFAQALICLVAAEAYAEVSQLLSQAGLLLLDRHFPTLGASIISQIPERIQVGCGWMSLFRGIQEMRSSGLQAEVWLELAYQRFLTDDDKRGQLLSLAKQGQQTILFEGAFEPWKQKRQLLADLAEELMPTLAASERLKVAYAYGLCELFFSGNLPLVDKIVTTALVDAQQRQLLEPQTELFYLHSFLSLQQGRLIVARSSLEQAMRLAVESGKNMERCMLQLLACELLQVSGDVTGYALQQRLTAENCSQTLKKNSITSSLLKYFQALLHIARGEFQPASEVVAIAMLEGVAATHAPLSSRLLQLRGWIGALEGDPAAAQENMNAALRQRRQLGADICCQENLMLTAITCYTLGQYPEAAEYLREAQQSSEQKGEERLRSGIYALSALTHAKLGLQPQAENDLRRFCQLLRRQQAAYFWGMTPQSVEELLELARDLGLGRQLIPLLNVQAASLDEQQQKIPLLKIFCLGRFQLQLEEQIFDMSQVGQPSRQIFAALLTAADKSISIEQLMGQLWPESSTSKARNSFDAALSRLRRGIENCFGTQFRDTYLVLVKGMLSLRHVQVDSLEFIAAIECARHHLQREHLWQAELQLWKMDQAWQGDFLSGFDLIDDHEYLRNQLTQIRIQQLSMLAQLLDNRQQYDQAVELLHRGLQLEPGHEQLVRQLLALYQKRQDGRATVKLLDNYRQALHNEDYTPEEIEELVDSLGAQWVALNNK
jgi:DNA-binding response OmpR family regulator